MRPRQAPAPILLMRDVYMQPAASSALPDGQPDFSAHTSRHVSDVLYESTVPNDIFMLLVDAFFKVSVMHRF